MKRKKIEIFIILFVLTMSISLSYAYWQFNKVQKDLNVAGTNCFSLTYTDNTDSLILDNIVPTEDEEGLKEKGYSFTIKNTCNTIATYEVNLEDILASSNIKHMPNKYIKVSLNDSTPKVLNTYEEVKTTISNATNSFKLTSGSLKPDEEATYELRLWMDSETPATDEVMSATFESKITVNTSYIAEENLTNDITIIAMSQNENYSKDKETFTIDITSTNKNIIEYSFNNQTWTSVTPTKKLTIEKEYNKEGSYPIYVKDEVGNIKEYLINTDKLDQTAPERKIESVNNQESYLLKITMTDTKSGMSSYQITESKETPSEWLDYTDVIEKEITQNGIYYIWSKDKLGNISYEAYSIDKIDKEAPSIELSQTLTDWGIKDTIQIHLTDDIIGLSGYQVTTSEEEPNDYISLDNSLEENLTYEVTENNTYYVYAKDAYNHVSHKEITIDKIDDQAPIINSITNSSNGTWTNQNVVTIINAEDKESGISKYQVKYSKTNNIWTDLTANTITFTSDLNETVYYRVIDRAGNISETKSTIIKIDKTAPKTIAQVSSSGSNIIVNASSSTDAGAGIKTYYFTRDNGASWYSSQTPNYTFSNLNSGNYTIIVRIVDNVGNWSELVSKNVTVSYAYSVILFSENHTIANSYILHNMIKNGGFESRNANWTLSEATISSEKVYQGSYAIKFGYVANQDYISMSTQILSEAHPTYGHKYYGSLMFYAPSGFHGSDGRYEWYYTDSMTSSSSNFVYALKTTGNGTWQKLSSIATPSNTAYLNNTWQIRNFVRGANAYSYADNILMMDLTYDFTSGHEPTQAFMDAYVPFFTTTATILITTQSVISQNYSIIDSNSITGLSCSSGTGNYASNYVNLTNLTQTTYCVIK